MKRTIATLLFLGAFSASAFAADVGPYVGIDVGQSSTDTWPLSTKTGTTWSVMAGYQFMKYVAAEIQYNDFGSPTITNGPSFKISGYSAAVLGILPVAEQWALLAKLGYASTKADGPWAATKSDFVYGVAGQYSLDRNWGFRLNWDYYTAQSADFRVFNTGPSQKAYVSVITLGALYRF